MDGFWFADEAIQAPSVTNRFFTSWHWLWAFRTEVFGSRPIRAVPLSWIVRPGGLSSTNGVMSFAPVASHELGMRRLHIPEPAYVDPVGTVPVDRAIFHARDGSVRPAAHRVVHEIATEGAPRVGEPGGEATRLAVEQDARRLECRSAQEYDARAELDRKSTRL